MLKKISPVVPRRNTKKLPLVCGEFIPGNHVLQLVIDLGILLQLERISHLLRGTVIRERGAS